MDRLYRQIVGALPPEYDAREARAVALLVLEEAFGIGRTELYAGTARALTEAEAARLDAIVARLAAGEPVQYVLGECSFCGLRLRVTPDVLIPRPETEEIVDRVLSAEAGHPLRVLDAGTGSGCIAVALALGMPGASVEAWDLSEAALAVARANAEACGARVRFARRDLLAPPPAGCSFDVVVSNPPYICLRERAEMDGHVLRYEPASALFVPDDDPLLFYRALSALGRAVLPAGGRMYLETNRAYARDVCALMLADGYAGARVSRDSYGNDRLVTAVR